MYFLRRHAPWLSSLAVGLILLDVHQEQVRRALAELERAGQRVARDLRRGVWSINLTTSGLQPKGCTVPAVTAESESTLEPDDLSMVVLHSSERFRYRFTLVSGELRLDEDRWDGTAWVDVADRLVDAPDGRAPSLAGLAAFARIGLTLAGETPVPLAGLRR